ncbi:HAMP domain-containing protein [Sulfurimonas sediminis]|uniref:histidine kinase n=1 Tax=Sulfurimonas sediminis TaxID=2590020 RepID=A0A7M1B1I1_9BACT|nr:ATP-binding protein [Sulfurimonas sediminis]QOP42512.1 HAMP domain-containing protein [Sulfurimonas sediminis]
MISFFKKSLRNKLLVSFLFVGLLPFAILLVYTIFLSQTKIVNQTIKEQFYRANDVKGLIKHHITNLKKEIEFIASLDLMDDIITDDIDKRISILLSKKATDFSLDLSLFVVNNDGLVIASSHNELLLTSFEKYKKLSQNTFIEGEYLYISSQILSSFDRTKKLGYLVLKYNLQNLTRYLSHQENIHSYIINSKTGIIVGDTQALKVDLKKEKESVITDKYVIVYERFDGVLKNSYLVYGVDKSEALKFLYEFVRFMLLISLFITVFVVVIALRYSKSIVSPIENLTKATQKITQEQDYRASLPIESEDEIATLTASFNEMVQTTANALKNLEEENKLRLKRFIQLIEVFNKIIQTQSEDECIAVSIKLIQQITKRDDLVFSKVHTDNSIDLYVTDFEQNKKIYFGSITLALESFSDENEKRFYNSIATMIALQLDRIRLIRRTMAASQAKSAFISNMSHELRTPLNAIIGFSQFLIAYEDLTQDQQETVGNIESSAHYLLGMINDILDIAKIEAGKMEAHIENVDLKSVVKSSYEMLKPLADEKNLEFSLDMQEYTLQTVHTDPKMFQQIITNLLSNAIKFTQEGFVRIKLYNTKEKVCVHVQDSGIGIDKEDLEQLFSDFTQVENVMQKTHKGTGLGLSLSKKMAQILGGDVTLRSEGKGKGSQAEFCFHPEP